MDGDGDLWLCFTCRTLGTVTVPLRDLVKNKKLDSSYDLVDGKGRPSLVRATPF